MAQLPNRKKQKKKPTTLPKDFLHTVSSLFQKQFAKNLEGASFLVYGDLYSDEAVLGVSMAHPKVLQAASLHISTDLAKNVAENPSKVTEKLKSMVDVAASWFSQCFQAGNGIEAVLDEMKDADPAWQEFDWEGAHLFVLLNKTNYTLENAADKFLQDKGFGDEGEDLLDALDDDDESEPLN